LGLGEGLRTPHHEKTALYETSHRTTDVDRSFGKKQESQNGHLIWKLECQKAFCTDVRLGLTLRGEYRLRVFDNRLLDRIL
jgi:hypothetical protein